MIEPRFIAVADHAVLVEFATEISDEAHDRVVALDRALQAAELLGVTDIVPAMVSLLVDFDPILTDHHEIESTMRTLLSTHADHVEAAPAEHRIVVCYDEQLAPDLSVVAGHCGLSVDAVIAAHGLGDYRVFMYGFVPGYAYLAGVPDPIQLPRKAVPVRGVAAGSVIIAGPQCLVTTLEMPTGWSVIGRSPTRVLRHDQERPFLFDVGDRIVFDRVDLATYERLERLARHG